MCNRSINGQKLLNIINKDKILKAYYGGKNEKFNFKTNKLELINKIG